MTTSNKTTTQAHDTVLIAGITKDLKTVSSMPLAGSTYTPVTLIALIQSRINSANAVETARANWLAAIAAYQGLNTQVHEVEIGLKSFVINLFGKTSPLLADFGWLPSKRATQTTADKAVAIAKRAATRKARGTMSPKQKAKITGTVEAPAAQPAAAPSATATAPAAATPTVNLVVTTAPVAAAPAAAVATVGAAATKS
jgi:hypothetical protein